MADNVLPFQSRAVAFLQSQGIMQIDVEANNRGIAFVPQNGAPGIHLEGDAFASLVEEILNDGVLGLSIAEPVTEGQFDAGRRFLIRWNK